MSDLTCSQSMIGKVADDVCGEPAIAVLRPCDGDDGPRCALHARDYASEDFEPSPLASPP
jgi:hypothetical protein